MHAHPRSEQQQAARALVRHLHAELLESVKSDIARQEGQPPAEDSLAELVADRDWLFSEHSYHIDTTHLASTVRFARVLEEADLLELALDLTAYGRRLHQQFQYHGQEPFGDIYPSHALYFAALLGRDVDAALDYFRDKAAQCEMAEHGTAPLETYVELLARLGRSSAALATLIEQLPDGVQPVGIAPAMLDLAQEAADYDGLLDYYRRRGDLIGYAATLLCRSAG